ncbi:hypothetical protein Afil01_03410 [Actinorhabdospora filicis]|uniref:Uncharacterized protein n=1 Tax=Actinorhabdospora filicis TaxID=1785913 RepID=A0A9W6SHG9_9ACTN|nr:hypothetical protein [Actinorhabdospora filicis]GLZ75534.1 hypothetical protein Afil01_03410 [Actinorhabdospora filicis]
MREALVTLAGEIDAPVQRVAGLLLTVHEGPVGEENLWLLSGMGATRVSGGPGRFAVAYPGGNLTVDVDREAGTIAAQGGWWYRGEWALTGREGGTLLTHRVRNVAGAGSRWAVPLANNFFRGFPERTRQGFLAGLTRVGEHLGCATRLVP